MFLPFYIIEHIRQHAINSANSSVLFAALNYSVVKFRAFDWFSISDQSNAQNFATE